MMIISRIRMQCRGSLLISGTDHPYCSVAVPGIYSRKNFWNAGIDEPIKASLQ